MKALFRTRTMNRWKHNEPSGEIHAREMERFITELAELLGSSVDPRELFSDFSRALESHYEIRKGFLALREGEQTRFLAVASWRTGGTRRNLSLRLPQASSFFEKVAESGQLYSENVGQFFDGNSIEKHLLFDDDTVSFMLRPLKHNGELIALLGYSSDVPDAFVTIQDGVLDRAFDQLAIRLAALLTTRVTA